MKFQDIRARMLQAALLPVLLVSLVLTIYFLLARFDDLQESYQQRIRAVARQLASSSEYSLFAGDQTQLQALANGALRESDVRWVTILDAGGRVLAVAGKALGANPLAVSGAENTSFDASLRIDWLSQPVFAQDLQLDELYEGGSPAARQSVQLGQVVLQLSRRQLDQKKQSMLLLGALISLLGAVFGMVLALRLSRGVIRPIMRVSNMIVRIGHGDFSVATEARSPQPDGGTLGELQENLRQMAQRLAWSRDELQQQVTLATQALREKKEEAELANLAKSRFLAAASHDLRQPTHALGMFVARLTQLPHDAQTRKLIENLEASVQAMQNLLDGLLDISRLEAQAVHVNPQPFALADLLVQLRHDLSQTALDKNLRLRIRPSTVWVMSDATLLYRILLNLVGNALRYTERGGVLVACRLIDGGQHARIEIWDTGIGIASEHTDEVFKEFFQVANAARDRNKGLGLGLNIVQRTCALLAHPLKVQSRVGVGSLFTVTVPCVEGVVNQKKGSVLAQEPITHDLLGMSVLVIEDDAMVRVALVGLLQSWGMLVSAAESVTEAQRHLASGLVPSLIISDYRLSESCNGMEAIAQLRSMLSTSVPACLISGDTDPTLIQTAQTAGLTLLHKPVRPAKLRSLIRHLVNDQNSQSLA